MFKRQAIGDLPLILNVEREDVRAGLAEHAAVVDRVVSERPLVGCLPGKRQRAAPEDLGVAAGIRGLHVVQRVLNSEAALQRVPAAALERVVVVGVEQRPLRRVEVGNLRARRVLRTFADPWRFGGIAGNPRRLTWA